MQVARLLGLFLVSPLATVPARSALAQDSTRALARCDGRTVTSIDIVPDPPAVMSDSSPAWRQTLLTVALQHVTTKPSVLKPFLLLKAGEPCTEIKRAESERLLRAQPFIADAEVRALPEGPDSVRITVRTTDEIPVVVGGEMRGSSVSSVTFGNSNVLGHGVYLTGNWKAGYAYRDGVGARFVHYHMFGRPYMFALRAQRDPHSSVFETSLGHEFLTNLQRTAWHAGYSDVSNFVSFRRPSSSDELSLNLDRQLWDIGGVWRIGLAAKRAFLGTLLTHERVMPAHDGVIISDSGFVADTSSVFRSRYTGYESLRLSAVLGARLLSYMRAYGFDALTAGQDVAKGVQIGLTLGRGIPSFGANDDRNFVSGDVYAGVGTPTSFLGIRVQGEGREDRTTKRWDAIVVGGRLAWYLKPSVRQTAIAAAEFTGAWRSVLPFQLALGDQEGGVRAYDGARLAGGQRAVARLEDRIVLGHLTQYVGVGMAAFVDAGKVWAGDVPFGVTTPIKTSVGFGLLAAIPPHSQRLLRVDIAVPVNPVRGANKWQLILSIGNTSRMFWREPNDIARVRTGVSPSNIFSWP